MKKVSTLVGVIIIIAVAVVLFGGVFGYQYFSKFQIQNSNTETTGPALSEVEGWKTYKNNEYGFEIKYLETDKGQSIYPSQEIVSRLPIAEDGTNIDGKVLKIVIKPKVVGVECVGPNYYAKSNNILTNDVQFKKQSGGEGAAGHGYAYTDYTTEKNNVCITLSFVISSYNDLQLPTYNGGKAFVKYDFSKEENVFNQIISTFKFTPVK